MINDPKLDKMLQDSKLDVLECINRIQKEHSFVMSTLEDILKDNEVLLRENIDLRIKLKSAQESIVLRRVKDILLESGMLDNE